MTCFACAARDAENRLAGEAKANSEHSAESFDGLYVAITEKGD